MRQPVTRTIRGQLVFLGTGTSHGVPVLGCGCAVCTSRDPRNRRTRCSVALGLPEGNLLVDTPPDLHAQLLREGIGLIHAVLHTHEHADHLFGLDDLRIFSAYLGQDLPLYCADRVERRVRTVYDYAFDPAARLIPSGGVPQLAIRPIDHDPFMVLGARVVPIPLRHGRLEVLGFRFGGVAYCTDTNAIPPTSLERLRNLDVLILDCLRPEPHPTHFSLEEAVEQARRIGARRTLFTHICHDLEHAATNALLPAGMELAYDGLAIDLPDLL